MHIKDVNVTRAQLLQTLLDADLERFSIVSCEIDFNVDVVTPALVVCRVLSGTSAESLKTSVMAHAPLSQ